MVPMPPSPIAPHLPAQRLHTSQPNASTPPSPTPSHLPAQRLHTASQPNASQQPNASRPRTFAPHHT
ncbi:hypothetical protein P692DRAFT_20882668 [Suillus brevipes Sb2]|nr:hypothetical protein P692DRAFT_20882668 [Suillus brevipes Sb2]